MQTVNIAERRLTALDFARLSRLVATQSMPLLDEVLGDAEVVAPQAIPADVVTMHAQFRVRDVKSRRQQVFVLCYPHETEPALGFISILSPAGMSLLGLPVGALASWTVPGGEEHTVRIEEIVFQPEASGDYAT